VNIKHKTRNRIWRKVAADIERFGWSAVGVIAGVDDKPCPPFTYTIGMYEQNKHPEFILLGITFEEAHTLLAILVDRVRKGERFTDNQIVTKVVRDYPLLLRALPPDGAPCYVARRYYALDELPVLQAIWPDAKGRFPHDPGCDDYAIRDQDIEAVRDDD